jgi:two-component system LytT family response regulator
MIQCLIVDDEPLAQDVIAGYVQQSDQLELVKKCSNVMEAFAVLQKQPVDLLFMDIKMPLINGIDFVKSLKNPPAVIFTTAFSEYAADSYEMEAVDYLLKPVTITRFNKSIDKYLRQINTTITVEKNYLYIKVDGRLQKIFYADILFAESMKDYMKIVTAREKYITHLTMKALVDLLPSKAFARIHRAFVVKLAAITAIARNEIQIGTFKIPVGEKFRVNMQHL